MSTIQPVYSWNTDQGDLELLFKKSNYIFCLKRNNQADTLIPCTKDNVALFSTAGRVQDVCERYFPILAQNHNEWTVELCLAVTPGDLVEEDEKGEREKNLGVLNFGFNSLEKQRQVNISNKGPFYKRVTFGLNLQGECGNDTCAAYQKVIFIQQGMGIFNIAQRKYKTDCPACHQTVPFEKVNNLGFWNCKYKIDGQRADKSDSFSPKEEIAGKERFTTFNPGEGSGWEYLQVTTTPLAAAAPQSSPQPRAKNTTCVIL